MTAPDQNESSASKPSVETLFAEYLSRVQAGEEVDLRELCADHPELADELERLLRLWNEFSQEASPEQARQSVIQSIRERFGDEADPGVSLDTEPADPANDSFEKVLDRLKEHSSSSPRYSLKGEVARRGMGAILRVWDEDLRRHLAMKVILGQGVPGDTDPTRTATPAIPPEILSRFLEEAQVTGQLDHPGIVPVHELGLDRSGRVYFTMRLVKGQNFEEVIRNVHERKRGWTQTRALGQLLKAW